MSESQAIERPASNKAAKKEPVDFNEIYGLLVANDADIVGQLAYCHYKQSKQRFLLEFQLLNKRKPSPEELQNHIICAEKPALAEYVERANAQVKNLLSHAAEEKTSELEEHFKKQLWTFIHRHERDTMLERAWHRTKALCFSGFGSVVGNVLTIIFTFLLLFGAASSETRNDFAVSAKSNFISGLAKMFNVPIIVHRGPSPVADAPDASGTLPQSSE